MDCRCTGGYRSFSYVYQKTFMIWASTDANVCRALSRQFQGNDSCLCYLSHVSCVVFFVARGLTLLPAVGRFPNFQLPQHSLYPRSRFNSSYISPRADAQVLSQLPIHP